MTRKTSALPKRGKHAATAWSLAVVSLAALVAGEPASSGGGELEDGKVNTRSSVTALRSTSSSSSLAQSGTLATSLQARHTGSVPDGENAPGPSAPMDLASAVEETTAPPEAEDTTTPAPPETPASILWGMKSACTKELYRSHYQWLNALIAFIFGIVMVFDGEHVFKGLVVAAAFLLTAVLAMSEVSELWGLGDQSHVRQLVGLEVGALGAYAAWVGLEGVMIIIGAIFGSFVAFAAQGKLVSWGVTSLDTNKWVIVLLYTLFTVGSVVIFKRKKHVKGLAVLSAAIGGALVSSAVSWFITHLAALGYMSSALRGLTPAEGPWVDFYLLLWSSSAADRGLFVDSSYNFKITALSGQDFRLDRVLGCSFWLLLFVAGAAVQFRALKTRVAEARGPRAESLREALLLGKE